MLKRILLLWLCSVIGLGTSANAFALAEVSGLTFKKLSGPSWLQVASDGELSGTPTTVDVGENQFVVQVTDPQGASSTTTLLITVEPEQAQETPPVVVTPPEEDKAQVKSSAGAFCLSAIGFFVMLLCCRFRQRFINSTQG